MGSCSAFAGCGATRDGLQLLVSEEVDPGELEPESRDCCVAEQVLDLIHEVVGLEDDTDQAGPRDKVIDEQTASGELAG